MDKPGINEAGMQAVLSPDPGDNYNHGQKSLGPSERNFNS